VDVFRIQGGARLVGEVHITGAKNSSLKLMAVALLAPGKTTIRAVPNILDVTIMAELLRRLGCSVSYSAETETVEIDVPATIEHRADYDLVRRMRASIAVLGPLVARTGAADVALPGGDAIGSRGLDMHTAGLERMGATVTNEHGYLVVHAPDGGLVGTHVYLDFPSVGATETLLMAAVTATGVTVIDNAAREPEIVDICNMLLAMGAQIDGVGTSLLTITGVSSLKAVEHTTVADRIVAGTWAVAAVITGGDITVRNANSEHLSIALEKLVTAGAEVRTDGHHALIRGRSQLSGAPVEATDIRAGAGLVLAGLVADGETTVHAIDHIDRGYVDFEKQLSKLGANIIRETSPQLS